MKYFDSIMELDSVVSQIENKLEIGKSQMNIIYDKLVIDAEVSKEDAQKRFFEMQMPFRIAFDYFYDAMELVKELREYSNATFDDAVAASDKMEISDITDELSSFDRDTLRQAIRFARAYAGRTEKGDK